MSDQINVIAAVDAVASNPKVGTAVAATLSATGAAAHFDVIQGYFSVISMGLGIATGAVVFIIQVIKLTRVWKSWKADQTEPRDV